MGQLFSWDGSCLSETVSSVYCSNNYRSHQYPSNIPTVCTGKEGKEEVKKNHIHKFRHNYGLTQLCMRERTVLSARAQTVRQLYPFAYSAWPRFQIPNDRFGRRTREEMAMGCLQACTSGGPAVTRSGEYYTLPGSCMPT